MYQVALQRQFIAQHYLIGGDWGSENTLHSHHFRLEVRLQGPQLDQHNYLFDISKLENVLDDILNRFRDKTLNDVKEFKDKNPSIELFCKIVYDQILADFRPEIAESMRITLWEDESAWASYENRLHNV